jgi:hypothetical protein
MTWGRLAFRLQPSSVAFAGFVCLGLAVASLWLTSDMRSVLEACGAPGEPKACAVIFAFQDTHGEAVMMTQMGIGLAMYGVPLVLGVPILTREIEQRTALIAWPLAGSRLKWLVWRALPVLVIGLILIGTMAFAAEQLAQAYFPHNDIGFDRHGSRGISLMTRSVLMLFLALLLGALIGRLLPALLVGIALAVGLSIALDAALPHWVESTELSTRESIESGAHPLNTDTELRGPDGKPISEIEAEAIYQAVYEEHGEDADPALLPQTVFYGVAPSRYGEVLGRESAVVLGATALSGSLAAVIVRRRRPE